MRSSKAAFDLIVAHEVSSRAYYERKLIHPELPGEQSGITVGIGYDLGYNTREDIARDWAGKVPPGVISAMQSVAGLTKQTAAARLDSVKHITIPWDAAIAVFKEVSVPKFEAAVLEKCPGSEQLPAGCFGVLTSLAFNRGPSFKKSRGTNDRIDRYREMRNIRACIMSGQLERVPNEIRSMKRLWSINKSPGLHRRRDEEADLWQASLQAVAKAKPAEEFPEHDIDEEHAQENIGCVPEPITETKDGLNVQPKKKGYSFEVELIQRQLLKMKYFEVGVDGADGLLGGKTRAAITAFMNDRGKNPNAGAVTDELKAELEKARLEKLPDGSPWSRPIAPDRANATAKDLAGKVGSVNPIWYQKIFAWILGLPAAATAGFKSIFGDDTTSGYIYQVKSIFSAIPTEYYLLGVVGLAVAIFLAAKSAQDRTVKAYNEGKIN